MGSIYDNYPAQKYVDEYERDNSEECKACKGNCSYIGMTGEWACQGFIPKDAVPRTNADRIRAMSDEELAEWIEEISQHTEWKIYLQGRTWLDWLKREVEHDYKEWKPIPCPHCGGSLSEVRENKGKRYRHCYACHFEFEEVNHE